MTSLARKVDKHLIKQMMANEKYLYVELHHKKELLELLFYMVAITVIGLRCGC